MSDFPLCKASLLLKSLTLSLCLNVSYLLSFKTRWSYISWLTLWSRKCRQYIILMKVLITTHTCKQTYRRKRKSKIDIVKQNNYPISFLLPCVLYIIAFPSVRTKSSNTKKIRLFVIVFTLVVFLNALFLFSSRITLVHNNRLTWSPFCPVPDSPFSPFCCRVWVKSPGTRLGSKTPRVGHVEHGSP